MPEPLIAGRATRTALTLSFYKPIKYKVQDGELHGRSKLMRHNYLKRALALSLLLGAYISPTAQITLHNATDVTQTKATLSADFPDTSVEHGFQYKYGTLPEIDDFSRCALASNSDPVLLSTTGNVWKNRDVKGWVESYSDLGNGQSSAMTATVTIYEPSTLSFEWSVDSEENYGILSFKIDGTEIAQISGEVPFTAVSADLATGEHEFEWTYTKKSATNVGLDLGMVRNINFQNTTPGDWVTKPSSSTTIELTNLYPGQSHLFRAFADGTYSSIGSFTTGEISCGSVTVDPITQSTATLSATVNSGDAEVEKGFILYAIEDPYFAALVSDDFLSDSEVQNLDFDYYNTNTYAPWVIENNTLHAPLCSSSNYRTSNSITLSFTINRNMIFSFDYSIRGRMQSSKISVTQQYATLKVICSGSTIFDTTVATSASNTIYTTGTYSRTLSAGSYTLTLNAFGYAVEAILSNLNLTPDESQTSGSGGLATGSFNMGNNAPRKTRPYSASQTIVITGTDDLNTKLEGLISDKTYSVYTYMKPTYTGDLEATWEATYSTVKRFRTLPVKADTPTVSELSQASALISGTVDGGDATIIATGLQYKDSSGTRWTDYPKDVTATEHSQKITRLKPNTGYDFRSYIQASECDTVFSETQTFTTLAVEALKPTLSSVTQHTATLEGQVVFGDASIYQRGMQFRATGDTEWEEVEDGGDETTFTLVKKDLTMKKSYSARTYIQPAGCDIIYSDVLSFRTPHYISDDQPEHSATQSTATVTFQLEECDEAIEEAGIGYNTGSHHNSCIVGFVAEDDTRVPGIIDGNKVTVTLTGLQFSTQYAYAPYVKVNGEYYYCSGSDFNTFTTKDVVAKITVSDITQTTAKLTAEINSGDAEITDWKYCLGDSFVEENAIAYEETTTLNGLDFNKGYAVGLFGKSGDTYRLVGLAQFTTKNLTITASFSNVTQTSAEMTVTTDFGDVEVTEVQYRFNYREYQNWSGEKVSFTGLTPNAEYTVNFIITVDGMSYGADFDTYYFGFRTKSVQATIDNIVAYQTSAKIPCYYMIGDATFVASGLEYGLTQAETTVLSGDQQQYMITELTPGTRYYFRSYVDIEEGGRTYSSWYGVTTSTITTQTDAADQISNRSARLNGTIDCDSYSSAEFGFQWKSMTGWISDPAFTKGVKNDNGEISVALTNGMLEPNTDYQYRTAVRYQDKIYAASEWQNFRTESEYVLYPGTVYTMYRTDRENNRMVFCGYYVAGSEEVVSRGYDYWKASDVAMVKPAATTSGMHRVECGDDMTYTLDPAGLSDGTYYVRAFIKTASGETYGASLPFSISGGEFASVDDINVDERTLPECKVTSTGVRLENVEGMSVYIYDISGKAIVTRHDLPQTEDIALLNDRVYVVCLSNGMSFKVKP